MALKDAIVIGVDNFGGSCLWDDDTIAEPEAAVDVLESWVKAADACGVFDYTVLFPPGIVGVVGEPIVGIDRWCRGMLRKFKIHW